MKRWTIILLAGVCLSGLANAGAEMNMDNTLSEDAQRNTIAFDGLAFLTGSLGSDSFFPPGKVADFWGFQYLRDNDPSNMGHNTDFLTRAANNMLYVLTDDQRQQLITLAKSQVSSINQYGLRPFRPDGRLPPQPHGQHPRRQHRIELRRRQGLLRTVVSSRRADQLRACTGHGPILASLTSTQRSYLNAHGGPGHDNLAEHRRSDRQADRSPTTSMLP